MSDVTGADRPPEYKGPVWPGPMRCPSCDYSPREDLATKPVQARPAYRWLEPECLDDELDLFEVAGCDEGCIMCPACAFEFRPPAIPTPADPTQGSLFSQEE